jgi:DNA-binding XRE family transcriptional regulator
MTQAHLARALNVSENYLYMVENAQKFPSLSFILRFGIMFSINPRLLKVYWLNDYISWVRERVKKKIGLDED